MNQELIEIIKQIIADVKETQETGSVHLLYERMLTNVEDLEYQIHKGQT
jgi:hypothetical protein